MKNILCPISDEHVNEQVTRFNAMFTIGIVVLAFVMNFFIRGFTEVKFSPINYASRYLHSVLGVCFTLIWFFPFIKNSL